MLFYSLFLKTFQEKAFLTRVFQKKLLLKSSLSILVFCFLLAVVSFVFFSVGLQEDGSHNLAHLLMLEKIRTSETARIFFYYFSMLPLSTYFKTSSSHSLSLITSVYSFSLIYIHILSWILCFLILPKNKKEFIFFPLFSFLTGAFLLLDISVSVALSVCSYLWLVAFMISYFDFSKKIHQFSFFVFAFPLILSHEMMSYLSLFFVFLILVKLKRRIKHTNLQTLFLPLLFFLFLCFLQSFLLFHSLDKSNFNQFQKNLFSFEFLWDDSRINLCLFLSLFIKVVLFLEIFKKKFLSQGFQVFFFFVLTFCFLKLLFLSFPLFEARFWTSDYAGRVYPPVLSFPLCLLAWFLAEFKSIELKKELSQTFLISCCLLALLFTFYRLKSDKNFYNYRKDFARAVEKCEGIVLLSDFKKDFTNFKSQWKVTADSLIFPEKQKIKAIIINDLCEKDCKKRNFKHRFMDCPSFCKSLNFDFPEESSYQFFKFKTVFKSYESGRNFCGNQGASF